MAEQIILPRRILDGNGDPISGAKVYAYIEGTTTLETVYADEALTTAHPSPLLTNAEGTLEPIWHAGDHGVKIIVTNADDVALDWSPLDPAPMTSSATTASNITYTPSTNNPASNVQDAIDNASNLSREILNKSADYTAILADRGSLIRATASMTLSTSAANVLGTGWFVELLADGGDLTVAPAGGATIAILKDGEGGTLFCNGTTFYIRRNVFARGTAGDIAYCDSNGDWALLPKGSAGQALVMNSGATAPEWGGSGISFIESKTISSQATLDFDTFDNTLYKSYKLVLTNVLPATDGTALRLQFSTDGGSTFDASTIYNWSVCGTNNTGSDVTASQSTGAGFIRPAGFRGIGNVASNETGVSGEIKIYGAASGVYTTTKSELGFVADNGNLENQNGFGQYVSTTEVDAVRLLFDSGNLTSGTVALYGLS